MIFGTGRWAAFQVAISSQPSTGRVMPTRPTTYIATAGTTQASARPMNWAIAAGRTCRPGGGSSASAAGAGPASASGSASGSTSVPASRSVPARRSS
ncbi:hypothetical protein ACFQX7_09470 [Luedemannella flava]